MVIFQGKVYNQRLIHQKVQKAIDSRNGIIITQKTHINILQQQLTDLHTKKRARVIPNPDEAFVQVIEVEKARRHLEGQLLGTEEAGVIDLSDVEISDSESIMAQLFGN